MAEANTGHAYSYHDSVAQQASALPDSGLHGQAEPANRPHEPVSAIVQEDYNCPICLDLLLEPVVGACGHEFCKDCYTRWLARSRAYPSCPLCRKVLAFAVPGVSRRLADLIEATFPEKIQLRRQTREREAATEATAAPLQGQASQLNVDELEDYEDPPVPEPAAVSPFVTDGARVMLMLQMARHSRRPDSPYPGRGGYEGTTDIVHSHASGLESPDAPDSPASSSDPSSASSLPDSYPGSPRSSSSSPALSPTSPYYYPFSPMSIPTSPGSTRRSPTLPGHRSGSTYSPIAHSPRSPHDSPTSPGYRPYPHSSPDDRPWATDNPYPGYASLTSGNQPFLDGNHDYGPVLRPRAPPRRASVSPQRPHGGAAGIAGPPSRPPSSVTEVLEMYRRQVGRTPPAARQGLDDSAPAAAAAAATTAETESTHDRPQLRAAPPQPAQHRDFSRLLQSTDQLAEQLQRASERLTYLTEYAGHSFARHGLAPPPLATQSQVSHLPYPSGTAYPYAGYWDMLPAPLAAYSHYGAPAPAAYPSVPLNSMPWASAYSYGHYAAPAPGNSFAQSRSPSGNSFAQSMPPPPGSSFAQATPPLSGSFAENMAPQSGSSFAQSMPPPGTLPFTMGSEPREDPDSSSRGHVAAVARNPARYRSRTPPSRRRGGGARALH